MTSAERAEAPAGRREEILAVAARLFAAEGFDGATMRRIGKEAGIQPASLYYHFATKEDLLDEIIRGFLIDLPTRYRALVAKGGDARQQLHELVALGFRNSLADPTAMSIIIHERKSLARLQRFAYVEETLREIERIWLSVLERGVRDGAFRKGLNLPLVLRTILDLAGAAVEWYRPDRSRYSLDEIVETQLGLIFHGIAEPD
jgi:AcrR family transcriptional regulator